MINSDNINFIVGNKNFKKEAHEPFNDKICNFLDQLSIYLSNPKVSQDYSDIKTFAFFCRKKNILNLKKKSSNLENRKGLGLLFHITPSNIPTNFAYSLIFGLLSGNKNIVKVPSKIFPQIDIICNAIKIVLKKFNSLENFIKIVRYSEDEDFTKKISLVCDGRLIWGGNNTINKIRQYPTKEISRDLSFADRNSFCIINSNSLIKIGKKKLNEIALKFYNDTFLVDQNACSSPHVIFWMGKNNLEIRKKFWKTFNKIVDSKYKLDHSAIFYKQDRLFSDFITKNNIKNFKNYGNSIYCVELNQKKIDPSKLISRWGYFYEVEVTKLKDLSKFSNVFTQTLTYFGFEKKEFDKLIKRKNFDGIDRIVPIGQALDISLNWDGYDIINILSKVIDIR